MSYMIALAAAFVLVLCLMTAPISTLIALAIAAVWWGVKGRKRSVDRDLT